MNVIKFRKFLLQNNWGGNIFMKEIVKAEYWNYQGENQMHHRSVFSGKAFWINNKELCTGYVMRKNPEIFRPIFSHKRQVLLNKVNLNIINPTKFWNKLKSKYFVTLSKKKEVPLECVKYIISFIY